ncbi:MAG: hypothetical protein L0323_07695 [Planctomycetes bacterium]|nr:hypothetical protein [Planctomycetota bacterium]
MRTFPLRCIVALAAFGAPAAAQSPADAVGFHWVGAAGNTAGPFCWGFQCAPDATTVSPGESATLLVRGDPYAVFVIGLSATATSCIPIPGISHSLVLDLPIYVAFTGTLDQLSPILSCPSGEKTIPIPFPTSAIPGTSLAIQAIVLPVSGFAPPSLTQAIVLTVV